MDGIAPLAMEINAPSAALHRMRLGFAMTLGLALCLTLHAAQSQEPSIDSEELTGAVEYAPVIIDGATLFRVRGVSAYPAAQRAAAIAERIRAVAEDRSISPDAVTTSEVPQGSRIEAGKVFLMGVIDGDVQLSSDDRTTVAAMYAKKISDAIVLYRSDRRAAHLFRVGFYALSATLVLAFVLWLGHRAMRRLDVILDRRIKKKLEGLEAQSFRILSATHIWRLLRGIRYLVWTAGVLIAVVAYLDFVLHLFPWTRLAGVLLLNAVVTPLRTLAENLLTALPDLIILVMLVWATRYLLKAIRLPFAGIARGAITVANFEREWAWPTYRLVRLLVIALAAVLVYPHVPGSESEAFKGVSILFGVLFSLGSTSVTANIIAGYSLIYRRTFKIGDYVRIDQHVGDVVDSRLLATYLRTPKNEQVIIPNSTVLNSSVVNYSTMAREGKLLLHTSVGIGYETPWRQVEAMLLQAAGRTPGLVANSKPFVLHTLLGDFCVVYELNVYCDNARQMPDLYADLHRQILDVFNEYGIQIMTPAYRGDPPEPKIVPKDQWYAKPAKRPDEKPD
jgi:small-conductance mechanosensitive channel